MSKFRVISMCVILGGLLACDRAAEETVESPLRPVRIAVVSNNGEVRERTFSGVSQSTQESRMSFKVAGTVTELPVQVGDQIKKGDLIASLNASSYELQVQQAEASREQARANKRNADANYKRVKGLYGNSNASRNDLDVARANAESAAAQVRSASKSLEIAQLNRSYTRLSATADCSVVSLDVEINENVSAGGQIAKINCGGGLEIRVGIPESLITQFERDMSAKIRFNAIPGRVFSGKISEVGVSSQIGSATFPLAIELEEFDATVRAGMAAEVSFAFANRQSDAYVIPTAAVINDERGVFVYIAIPAEENTAKISRRPVETGELLENGIQITAGLKEGDRVVTAGTSFIREQQIVLLPKS